MLDWIGWIATALFAGSYFCKRPIALRSTQAVAALVWVGYGIAIAAAPVVVANLSVALMAAYSAWREHCRAITDSGAALPERERQRKMNDQETSGIA
jgi:hypothetical protein